MFESVPAFVMQTMRRRHFMPRSVPGEPAMEESLHDVRLLREFGGPGNRIPWRPDESTIPRLRQPLRHSRC
jgi:hypothetical protein